MDKAVKGGNVLWKIISIITLFCVAGALFFMFQERAERIAAEERFKRAEQARQATQKELRRSQLEVIRLKDQAQQLADKLAVQKRNYQTTLAELEQKAAQIVALENDLSNEKKQSTNLANTLAQLRENYNNLQNQLKAAESQIEQLRDKLGKTEGRGKVELEKIVVKPKKKLEGRILVVNREFHFVVIDLGKKDGLKLSDEFTVYRGDEEIGKVRVERIYEAMSTADILAGSQETQISEDDTIRSF